ncbi:MAG: carbon-nitrogen family hydrolase [Thermodesulfovibrionales bacterium]|nr:carbon-nitrogen family hydrolase [Thermodesulfovibrionales bacterium]
MSGIKVSVAQFDTKFGDIQTNLQKTELFIKEASKESVSLICFPEMWLSGFDWQFITANKHHHNEVIDLLIDLAHRYGIWLNGSIPYVDKNGNVFNSSILISPEKKIEGIYSKMHLFKLIGEDKHLSAGNSIEIVETPWGRTGLAVCYDIRFPELFRLYALKGVETMIICAAFPDTRINHWRTLVCARAIENQMYVIAVNRAGQEINSDGVLTKFGGHSLIVDPWGEIIAHDDSHHESILYAKLDTKKIKEIRKRLPVFSDRKPDVYKALDF